MTFNYTFTFFSPHIYVHAFFYICFSLYSTVHVLHVRVLFFTYKHTCIVSDSFALYVTRTFSFLHVYIHALFLICPQLITCIHTSVSKHLHTHTRTHKHMLFHIVPVDSIHVPILYASMFLFFMHPCSYSLCIHVPILYAAMFLFFMHPCSYSLCIHVPILYASMFLFFMHPCFYSLCIHVPILYASMFLFFMHPCFYSYLNSNASARSTHIHLYVTAYLLTASMFLFQNQQIINISICMSQRTC
jgi:hypothetical protein